MLEQINRIFSINMNHYHKHFGSVSAFPDRMGWDNILSDDVQPPGNCECVCYSVDDVAQDSCGKEYDIDELYSRVPHAPNAGVVPEQAIAEVLKNGIKVKATGVYEKPFASAFVAHTGPLDAFDNVRSAMTLEDSSIMAWGQWDCYWGASQVMTEPANVCSDHCVSVKGWDIINGEPMLIIEAHIGKFLYVSRSVFNAWANESYFGTSVLSNKIVKTIMQKMIEAMTSLVSLYSQLLNKKKVCGIRMITQNTLLAS